eukprot:CAMPEP_0174869246 /NCGR_PEP_ID=MMETSP1114-20130205/67551_1 /TAXON_ID=312471 /ORGANISM="Neobodo designis, Strain CCAP 1951/1" /LENGTH=53 /DNA_ID=CAMNT_0016104487 /DNA_START=35 /DNA_END=193 /DNA_ORIENTATION=-
MEVDPEFHVHAHASYTASRPQTGDASKSSASRAVSSAKKRPASSSAATSASGQ